MEDLDLDEGEQKNNDCRRGTAVLGLVEKYLESREESAGILDVFVVESDPLLVLCKGKPLRLQKDACTQSKPAYPPILVLVFFLQLAHCPLIRTKLKRYYAILELELVQYFKPIGHGRWALSARIDFF